MCKSNCFFIFNYASSRFLFSKRTERTKTAGKTQPASTPIFKLSFAACVTSQTMPGPTAPPRSPAIARKANIAVPPSGIFLEAILIVPGHMMPTEKPHKLHPTRFKNGSGASAASR